MARPVGTKYIETPEKMWELFEAYKKETKAKPILKTVFVGKDGQREKEDLERPLTMEGFECYVMDHTKITYPDLTEYFEGKNESYKDYFPISSRIRREIRKDQIELGLTGVTNANLTARINAISDKTETELSGSLNVPNLPDIGKRK